MKLNKKEKKLITECLLFASSVDICAEWPNKCAKDMIKLAKKVNDCKVKLDEIYLFDLEGVFGDPKIVKRIIKHFPNLPRK